MLKSEAPSGTRERIAERRSRTTKGIVVLIDGDSRSCDQLARAVEVHGYHVLTAENPGEGAALVRLRRPDAVIATEDDNRALRDIVTSHLRPHAPLILRCRESNPDLYTDVNAAGHSRIVRVNRSLGAIELGWLLDRVVEKCRG